MIEPMPPTHAPTERAQPRGAMGIPMLDASILRRMPQTVMVYGTAGKWGASGGRGHGAWARGVGEGCGHGVWAEKLAVVAYRLQGRALLRDEGRAAKGLSMSGQLLGQLQRAASRGSFFLAGSLRDSKKADPTEETQSMSRQPTVMRFSTSTEVMMETSPPARREGRDRGRVGGGGGGLGMDRR